MIKDLKDIYSEKIGTEVKLQGWIRNHRKQKEFGFIDFNDGTHFKTIQLCYDSSLSNFEDISKLHIGSAITVDGIIAKSLYIVFIRLTCSIYCVTMPL